EELFAEEDDSRDELYRNISNHAADDEVREMPLASRDSFQELLKQQLGMFQFDEKEEALAAYIIGNIDENGYLKRTAKEISNDLLFNMNIRIPAEHIQKLIDTMIHRLEPAGVGAQNLQECLLLQMERMPQTQTNQLATEILTKTFTEFLKKNYSKIKQKLHVEMEEVRAAIEVLVKLDPKPGDNGDELERKVAYISPDFEVKYNEKSGELELTLPKYDLPELCVRKSYRNLYEEIKKKNYLSKAEKKENLDFIKQSMTSAEWFIESLSQRETTLYRTMECIIDYQKEFFQTGDETTIKPMVLKNIAEKIGMNISTVSRITSSKYVATPYGTYPLKYFFSESMEREGTEVSSIEVKRIIKDTIQNEDKSKPYTDDDLQDILAKKGYKIARRTVAKYREQIGIPTSRLRK
ncbi:MAG: RNA polymerase factor sigma-54, partial [Bacteroidales bacterium]|nr:RNA polymerase factor sigma-54 [Bacteroidales bacterium]